MVDFDNEFAYLETRQHLMHDGNDLRIGKHRLVLPCNIKILKDGWRSKLHAYTLIEFSKPTPSHDRLIPAIDLADMVSLYGLNMLVHCKKPCKWNGKIVTKRTELAALVLKVKDELGIFAIFICKNLLGTVIKALGVYL